MSARRMGSPRVVAWEEMRASLDGLDLVGAMEDAFVSLSRGECVIPPVGELVFDEPPGDVHIKYGYIRGAEFFVVKIASGFHRNLELGLATSDGMMLLFRQATGEPVCVLLDEGRLTDIRTAAAGAVVARHFAPATVERIGILGTGIQAREQLLHLRGVIDCEEVLVCGREERSVARYLESLAGEAFNIEGTLAPGELLDRCNLIVTTTPSTRPLLDGSGVRPGTHITAVGSDTAEKQELECGVLEGADLVVADSIEQCRLRGEISQALRAGAIDEGRIVELGAVISGAEPGRLSSSDTTVVDLTGVAVQDLAIACAVYAGLQ